MKRLGTVLLIILSLFILAVSCKDDKAQTPRLIVSFNANGAEGSMGDQTITGSGALDSCKFTYTYKKFTGWNTAIDGSGMSFSDGATISTAVLSGNITLYAQWEIDYTGVVFTITYDKNNADAYGTTAASEHTYGVAKALTPNGFDYPGMVFACWNTAPDGSGTSYADGQTVTTFPNFNPSGMTLYAIWGEEVEFLPNGAPGASSKKTVMKGSAYGELPTGPVWAGYDFVGWFTEASGGTQVTSETIVTSSMSHPLFAHWEGHSYQVNYYKNSDYASGTTTSSEHTYGTPTALTSNGFSRPYYSFVEWNTESDGSGTSYEDGQLVSDLTTVDGGEVNLYAIWAAIWTTNTEITNDVTISDRVVISGDVYLTLGDGTTLTVPNGINVPGGSKLFIIGAGTLRAETSDKRNAAIGGDNEGTTGDILILNGTIIASVPSGSHGAAIGSGANSDTSGTVMISGGTVTASASNGAGIGCGGGSFTKTITVNISGGTINASAGEFGCGIGNGKVSSNASVSISGGTITATGGTEANGIGGTFETSRVFEVSSDNSSWTDYNGTNRKRYMRTK